VKKQKISVLHEMFFLPGTIRHFILILWMWFSPDAITLLMLFSSLGFVSLIGLIFVVVVFLESDWIDNY